MRKLLNHTNRYLREIYYMTKIGLRKWLNSTKVYKNTQIDVNKLLNDLKGMQKLLNDPKGIRK